MQTSSIKTKKDKGEYCMKIYKKLALVVACLATSETMPSEKPAPDPSTIDLNNDYCLAALELASMLPKASEYIDLSLQDHIKTLESLLKLDENGETLFPLDLSKKEKALQLLQKMPDNTKLNLASGRKISLLKGVRESMINDLKEEIKYIISTKDRSQKEIDAAKKIQIKYKKYKENERFNKDIKKATDEIQTKAQKDQESQYAAKKQLAKTRKEERKEFDRKAQARAQEARKQKEEEEVGKRKETRGELDDFLKDIPSEEDESLSEEEPDFK